MSATEDAHARVARMLENSFHRNQTGKASRWNNERRTNAEGAKLNPHVERVPLPRNVSPAPPLPDWREKLAALEIEVNDAEVTEPEAREEYERIAATAREAEPYDGVLLQFQNDQAQAVCKTCGPLPPMHRWGWSADWINVAGYARDHVRDHPGHSVAVQLTHSALYESDDDFIYRPEDER